MIGQELLTIRTLNDSVLTASQLTRKAVFQDSKNTESLAIVKVNNILHLQNSNIVKVCLPEIIDTFYFKGTYIEYSDTNQFNWTGELVKFENEIISEDTVVDGALFLSYLPERTFGELSVDSLYYQLRDLTGGLSALIKMNDSIFSESCGMNYLSGGINGLTPPTPPPISPFLEACPVNILVLYTESAIQDYPDIEDLISIGINNTNEILKNSEVSRSILFFDNFTTLMLPGSVFTETEDINYDKELIHSIEYIKSLRNQYEADFVILLTSDIYSGAHGAVSAIGLDDGSAIHEAYAIVETGSISAPLYTFSHEIFHLYGAHHEQQYDEPEETNCPAFGDDSGNTHAHGFLIKKHHRKKRRHTIMAVCLQDVFHPDRIKKIKHISNPNVKYKKWKTGIEDTNYNALHVKDIACVIANYRYSFRPFAYIVGPNQVCATDEYIVLTAVVGGLQGNYDFFWRYSIDGLTWSDYIETYNNILSLPNTFTPGTGIFFELMTGTSSENMMKTYWSSVIQDAHAICIRSYLFEKENLPKDNKSKYSVFPNPTSGLIAINNNEESDYFEITLLSPTGVKLFRMNGSNKFISFKTENLQAGLYLLQCSEPSGYVEFHKLIIQPSN